MPGPTESEFVVDGRTAGGDSRLQVQILRPAVAELLRSVRLYQALLGMRIAEMSRRGLTNSRHLAFMRGLQDAIEGCLRAYEEDVLRSLHGIVGQLYGMVILHMSLNLNARRGVMNELSRHLDRELAEWRELPWSMMRCVSDDDDIDDWTASELLDAVSRICEQLGPLRVWLKNGNEAETEAAFTVLAGLRKSLKGAEELLRRSPVT